MNTLLKKLKEIGTTGHRAKMELVACEHCGAYSFWRRTNHSNTSLTRTIKCCAEPQYWHVNLEFPPSGYFNITNSSRNIKIGKLFRITAYYEELLMPDLVDNPWVQTYEAVL